MQITMHGRLACGLVAIVALAGCESRGTSTGTANGTTSGGALAGRTPRQATDDFLNDLGAGTVTPARLTPGFKELLTRPVTGEKKKLSYSDEPAREFLKRFDKSKWTVGEFAEFGPYLVARGRVEMPKAKSAFSIRLTQRGDVFVADWIQVSDHFGTSSPYPSDPDLALAQDVVRNFLELLLGGDTRQAHSLMLPAWRKSLSPLPPNYKSKDDLDYEPAFLIRALRAWASGATTFALSDAKLSQTRDEATFAVELEAEGKKIPHTVRAKKVAESTQWLVAGFDN
jgi:hypothetical protein